MEVLLLGHPKSPATRKAQRFLSERRVPFHDRDLRKRPATPGELRRWVDRFGIDGLLDTTAKAYREQGLRYLGGSTEEWTGRLAGNPLLLRLPLLRYGSVLVVGDDPGGWGRIVDAVRGDA